MWSRFRIYFLIGFAMVVGMTASQWAGNPAIAVQQEDPRTADLRDRLISGLKVRTNSERQFIEQVLQRVESNEIPQKLVDSAFLWVRSNKANHDYPFSILSGFCVFVVNGPGSPSRHSPTPRNL